ncbi:MAG TPA: twin-arginine translocation signal domain-containing protein, partial [Actinomycetes bacterium]|nr:twin-arginine translocation signal domain-containing protein [Actinomycetes bacterium]
MGAGRFDRRNFLKAGAGAVVAAVVAWRFWPWRTADGPTTPAGPAPEPVPPPAGLAAVDRLPTDRTRTWLGPP